MPHEDMPLLLFAPHIELLGAGDFLLVVFCRWHYADAATTAATWLHLGAAGQHLALDIHSDYLDGRLDVLFFVHYNTLFFMRLNIDYHRGVIVL